MSKNFYLLFFVVTILYSCSSDVNFSLNMADENQEELEFVLNHFHNNSNTLKYEAAKFLIENMSFHYTYKSEAVDSFND